MYTITTVLNVVFIYLILGISTLYLCLGFRNHGNTCYLNSVLQSLLGLPSFTGDMVALLRACDGELQGEQVGRDISILRFRFLPTYSRVRCLSAYSLQTEE